MYISLFSIVYLSLSYFMRIKFVALKMAFSENKIVIFGWLNLKILKETRPDKTAAAQYSVLSYRFL